MKDVTIPPLIIMRGTGYYVSDANTDTRSLLTPEVIGRSSAYVIHDPDGSLREEYRNTFREYGYEVKVLNLSNLKKSMRYNPFEYVRDDGGIQKLTAALMDATNGLGEPGDTDFLSCETLLLTALVTYVYCEAPDYERNIGTVMALMECMEQDEGEEEYMTAVDYLFMDKEEADPEHMAVRKYREFEEAAGEDAQRVVASCAARLTLFDAAKILHFMSGDDLGLNCLPYNKTALFVMDGAPSALNFLSTLMYAQLFDLMCGKAFNLSTDGYEEFTIET